MDRLILGDNQFFGINHVSEERARAQAMQFRDVERVIEVLDEARDVGISTFMCTTHEKVGEVVGHVRLNSALYPGYEFYPCMPYAHKYANAVTEDGMMGALKRFVPQEGVVNAIVRGGKSLATRNIEGVITLLVDAEMAMFSGVRTPVVFLQNVVVDLLLGLGFDEPFRVFADHVRHRYGAEPGFITMNLPLLLESLDRIGIDNPIVCANFNKLAFRVSGGVGSYAAAFDSQRFRLIAMSVFASGAIPPREALEWLREFPAVESIVFGASSAQHLRSTRELVDELWADAPVPAAS
jgi:hypothetical protein